MVAKGYLGYGAVIFVVLACSFAVVGAPAATAQTDADWAWPGMQFDVYKGGSWYSCSVGYPAWDDDGTRYFITASHCFRDEDGRHYQDDDGTTLKIYSAGDHSRPVGFEETFPKPKDGWYTDISLVQMYPGRKLQGYSWRNIPDDPAVAAVGDPACLIGLNHDNANCGKVTEVAAEMTPQGAAASVRTTRASYCSHPGDSGGAVYNRKLDVALGINITGNRNHNEPGTSGACQSSYIPIGRALRFLRQRHPSLSI
ncbi:MULTISPECIES: trypsin-like serine protease [unclassified Mycobacteroides]|uniref:trypsin-like serine protease n=1 Tax=unclassified Mycobacteroides TaxID=2618759 RepID=UPI000713F3C5|nr:MULTISPECIES: trypsin-like serine protease [unclassified Mycobacteroides]KRQ23315.1 hypothetical protein AOT91_23160 [Mycobacteroides sp. H092]KRQ84363.1 hypothetical protein AOT93_05510 [Mycobacteroides sp. H110]KRQ23484.1 hypothetical protein AOT87_12420 [Mycobacteroides sp. H003]KRQ40293.1 hypothetical protein AOT92_15050 [Mycobacteroides sp. H101]KRQ47394.1 hypothetical protein AOT88_15870 [Mycobacteroides sp. H063]